MPSPVYSRHSGYEEPVAGWGGFPRRALAGTCAVTAELPPHAGGPDKKRTSWVTELQVPSPTHTVTSCLTFHLTNPLSTSVFSLAKWVYFPPCFPGLSGLSKEMIHANDLQVVIVHRNKLFNQGSCAC